MLYNIIKYNLKFIIYLISIDISFKFGKMKQFIIILLIAAICLSYRTSVEAQTTTAAGTKCVFDSQCANTASCVHNGLNPGRIN